MVTRANGSIQRYSNSDDDISNCTIYISAKPMAKFILDLHCGRGLTPAESQSKNRTGLLPALYVSRVRNQIFL